MRNKIAGYLDITVTKLFLAITLGFAAGAVALTFAGLAL
jgi:hypothetical protein